MADGTDDRRPSTTRAMTTSKRPVRAMNWAVPSIGSTIQHRLTCNREGRPTVSSVRKASSGNRRADDPANLAVGREIGIGDGRAVLLVIDGELRSLVEIPWTILPAVRAASTAMSSSGLVHRFNSPKAHVHSSGLRCNRRMRASSDSLAGNLKSALLRSFRELDAPRASSTGIVAFLANTTGTDSSRPLLCICSLAPVRGRSAVVLARGIAMGGMGTVSILRRIHGPHVRRGSLVAALIFSGFVLVACGDDDDDEDPTEAPGCVGGQTTQPAASASPAASPGAGAASPAASPAADGATPVAGGATPVASGEGGLSGC